MKDNLDLKSPVPSRQPLAPAPCLLVVDDEPSVLHVFRRVFEREDVKLLTAETGAEALAAAATHEPDVVVLDVLLPDQSGLELFERIRRLDPRVPVLFITAGGTSDTAIEAMKLGALDYLVKPLDFAQVRQLVARALEIRRLASQPVLLRTTMGAAHGPKNADALVGRCGAMQEVYKAIGRVASQSVTVLICGESGTGKELVARALYHHGNRRDELFMAVNCAAIPEPLLESELFGHEKGAYTGADRRRIGKFEQCSGGTLLLDEIGDMPPLLQSKMLRLLQEQRFERVGGNETIQTDARIIAATNRDLEQMVAEKQFRSDLYYRLSGFVIKLPPLRERGGDLLLLVDHYLARANQELNKNVHGVAPEAFDLLQQYAWPGNVRELQSVLRQAVLQTSGPVLLADFLPESVRGQREISQETVRDEVASLSDSAASVFPGEAASETPSVDAANTQPTDALGRFIDDRLSEGSNQLYDQTLARVERQLLSRVLTAARGNQVEAARILGISRTTLRAKLRQLGLTVDHVVQTREGGLENRPE